MTICYCLCKTTANLGSFRILLPFSEHLGGVGVLNSAIFNSFHKWGWFWHDFGRPSEFRGGVWTPPPAVHHWLRGTECNSGVLLEEQTLTYSTSIHVGPGWLHSISEPVCRLASLNKHCDFETSWNRQQATVIVRLCCHVMQWRVRVMS